MPSQTRATLLDAAIHLLDAGGLDAVTLREVSHRAGVSHNAPYKHFTDKEALLAAIAAVELQRLGTSLAAIREREPSPAEVLRAAMREYVTWAMTYPARFKLVFGVWTTGTEELAVAANASRTVLIDIVTIAQRAGLLPPGDSDRLTALLQALVHGAVDLALIGHLSPGGKGHASPEDLVDDLLGYLRIATNAESRPVPERL